MTAEKSIKILKAVKELKDDAIYTLTDLTEAYKMAIEALSKQSASSEQADQYNEQVSYKAQVEILADVLDSCPLTEPCDWIWSPTGWCQDHCKDGQDSPDAECWLEYARVMTESKTESDHIADSDKMVDLKMRTITERLIIAKSLIDSVIADSESDQFREDTKKIPDVPDTNVGDMISRQAAIDALDEIESEVADGYGYQYEKWRKYFCGLPSAQPEQKWIPCSERLPEQYGNYLVSYRTDDFESDIGTFDPDRINSDTGEWSACDANGFYWVASKGLEVIAWMPLPEPYREGE